MKRACDVPLSAMTKVEGGHHCDRCDKVVWDLRAATLAEAEALFARAETTPCVRILPDARGFAVLRPSRAAMVGAALFAATAMGCEEPHGTDHAAHPGDPHTDEHTDEIGLAGEPMMEDVPEAPPEGEAPPPSE